MQDSPTAAELVVAVREFLAEKIAPDLEGHTAFHARVAMNALSIIERELTIAPAANAAERERLSQLLGRDGPLDALNAALSEEIRSGRMGLHTPGLFDHLRETALTKVAIDQPNYSGYREALATLGREHHEH